MGIPMIFAAIVIAWIAGILIGAAISYDQGFNAGKSWGYQLGSERRGDQDMITRIRSMM
jgi:hypothetical protein